jgi:hypothetical protein
MRRGYVAVYVEEGDAELDDLEEVDVAANGLVVVRGFGVEVADWARDDTGKFRVLGVE